MNMLNESDKIKDSAWPNDMWSKEAVELFNHLRELGGDWKKLCRDSSFGIDGSRGFAHAFTNQEPERLFEYAMFHNAKLQQVKAVVQFGLYTRGPVGHVHGGAIATILDYAIESCIKYCGYTGVTASMKVDYRRPIPLNTTTLVEARIERVEVRKVFGAGEIRTVDGSEIYSKATSLFVLPESHVVGNIVGKL